MLFLSCIPFLQPLTVVCACGVLFADVVTTISHVAPSVIAAVPRVLAEPAGVAEAETTEEAEAEGMAEEAGGGLRPLAPATGIAR
ncbi:unnamed protein product, partial [Closterium sp. NIES-64]